MRLVFLIAVMSADAAAQQKCDARQLDKLEQALTEFGDQEDSLATRGLFEACGPAMPPALSQALRDYSSVSPDMRRMVGLRALKAEHALWMQACPAGDTALIRSLELPREEQLPALQRACALDWITSDEAKQAGPSLELAILTHFWLRQHDLSAPRARRLARAMAHVEHPRRDAPMGLLGHGTGKGGPSVAYREPPPAIRVQPLQQGYAEQNDFMDRALPKLAACRQKKLTSFVLGLSFDESGLSRINVEPHPKGLVDCVYRAVVHKEWPRGRVELRYRLTFL